MPLTKRIRQNIYGNWNGYLGKQKVIEFGLDSYSAQLWIDNEEEYLAIEKEEKELRKKIFKE